MHLIKLTFHQRKVVRDKNMFSFPKMLSTFPKIRGYKFLIFSNTLFYQKSPALLVPLGWYWCLYLHRTRESVSPVLVIYLAWFYRVNPPTIHPNPLPTSGERVYVPLYQQWTHYISLPFNLSKQRTLTGDVLSRNISCFSFTLWQHRNKLLKTKWGSS